MFCPVYAATCHKAHGETVDREHVLATPGMYIHSAYVARSRHRGRVDLHYGQNDFADQGRLVRTLSRDRAKDMTSDYAHEPELQFAERRGISFRDRVDELVRQEPEKVRGMFDGLRLPGERPAEPDRSHEAEARQKATAILHPHAPPAVRNLGSSAHGHAPHS